MGYQVLEAGDAMEGVRLIVDRGGIDLLFTDVGLPGGVNGRALADAARSAQPGLRVLFTTGYTRNAILHNGVLDHGVHFIAKPFNLDALAEKIREVLTRRRQRAGDARQSDERNRSNTRARAWTTRTTRRPAHRHDGAPDRDADRGARGGAGAGRDGREGRAERVSDAPHRGVGRLGVLPGEECAGDGAGRPRPACSPTCRTPPMPDRRRRSSGHKETEARLRDEPQGDGMKQLLETGARPGGGARRGVPPLP